MFIYKRCNCIRNQIKPNISKSKRNTLAGLLKLASVPARLYILLLLDGSPHCVCDIMTHGQMSQTLASHHLSDLMKADLVESQKNGQFVDYSLTKKGKTLISNLLKITNI
jgi:ArsR family transcriptional regulator, arsenate/arsenite/antimonite-responsive transcriptional repressor